VTKGKRSTIVRISVSVDPQHLPPLHVGFVSIDQVGDEIQAYLCDLDIKDFRAQFEKGKEKVKPGEAIPIELQAQVIQKVYLSKMAVLSLYQTLKVVVKNLDLDSEESTIL